MKKAYVIGIVAFMVAITAAFSWPKEGSLVAPHLAGVGCNQDGVTTICSYNFKSTETCPNVPPAKVQFVRCPDFPQGIGESLCALYGGIWTNGCCKGPYTNAKATLISPDSSPPNVEYPVSLEYDGVGNAIVVYIPIYEDCGPNPLDRPGIYPLLAGTLKIMPLSGPEPTKQCDIAADCQSYCMTHDCILPTCVGHYTCVNNICGYECGTPPVPTPPTPQPLILPIVAALMVIAFAAAAIFIIKKWR